MELRFSKSLVKSSNARFLHRKMIPMPEKCEKHVFMFWFGLNHYRDEAHSIDATEEDLLPNLRRANSLSACASSTAGGLRVPQTRNMVDTHQLPSPGLRLLNARAVATRAVANGRADVPESCSTAKSHLVRCATRFRTTTETSFSRCSSGRFGHLRSFLVSKSGAVDKKYKPNGLSCLRCRWWQTRVFVIHCR